MSTSEKLVRRQVQLESPFGAPTREGIITNVAYALLAMRDSLYRGESPFASHLLYTQMLDDTDPTERKMGIDQGLVIADNADLTAVYTDLGISRGMEFGIAHAEQDLRPIVYRKLYEATLSRDEIIAQVHASSPLPLETIGAVYARIHL